MNQTELTATEADIGSAREARAGLRARVLDLLRQLKGGDEAESGNASDNTSDNARAGLGALFTFAIRIASALITFAVQVLLARWLGGHDFGVYTYVWVWVNVVGTLCAFGLSSSAVRFIAEYATHDEPGLLRGFLRFGRWASFMGGALAAAVGIAVLQSMPGIAEHDVRTALSIGLLSLPAFALTDFHDGTGRARSWIGLAFIPPYILRPLLLLIFVGLAALIGTERDATVAAAALVAATWIVAIAQLLLQERRFRREVPAAARAFRHAEWIKVSLPLLLLESFALMMMNIDVLLLKLFVTPTDIGIYFAAARTISFVSFIHFAIVAVAMPRFATAYARHDIESAGRLLGRFRLWTFAPSLLASVVLLAIGPYVLAMFGPQYPAAWPVMVALAGGHLARALAGPAEALLAVSGRQVYTAVVGGITAALNIGLNLALIPKYGLLGAGAATAISFAFQALVLSLAARRLLREGYHAPVTCAPAAQDKQD